VYIKMGNRSFSYTMFFFLNETKVVGANGVQGPLVPAYYTCRSIHPLVTDFSLKGFDPQVKWKLSCAAVSMNTEGYFALAKN